MHDVDLLLQKSAANAKCFDCGSDCRHHFWISVQHGILICIRCAGVHRSLGVDVSFVRSLKLDMISAKDLTHLKYGGNSAFADFLETLDPSKMTLSKWFSLPIEHRYFTPAADLYRRQLATKALGNDQPLPTDLRIITPPKSLINAGMRGSAKPQRAKTWTPDSMVTRCELCTRKFSLLWRRHHCRRCGKCICQLCSPPECFRPLPPIIKPCRHCTSCVAVPAASFNPSLSSAAF